MRIYINKKEHEILYELLTEIETDCEVKKRLIEKLLGMDEQTSPTVKRTQVITGQTQRGLAKMVRRWE